MSSYFQELVKKIIFDPVERIETASNEFNNLIENLLQKDSSKRISWEELLVHPV